MRLITDGGARRRVFLFGLDGATWTLLRPWAEQGYLPALARLTREGAWGPLESTTPASTPVAWNSMVTGVYPGKHGVFGFVKRRPDSYELEIITSRDRRRPAIWNLLDAAGLRSIIVDVPFTYPPEPVNGIMVAGLGTPDVTTEFVHPRWLRDVILREFGSFPLDIYYHGDVEALVEDARRLTEHRMAVARFLLREFAWDFFMLGLMTTDRLQHVAWRFLDPGHSRYDPEEARRYGPLVLDYYRRVDEAIGELAGMMDTRTAFLMASDHGFGPMERSLSLLRWLGQAGLVALGGRCWEYTPPARPQPYVARGPGRVIERPSGAGPAGLTFEVDRPDEFAGAVFRLTGLDPHCRYELRAAVADATPGILLEFDDLARPGNPIIGGGPVHGTSGEVSTVFQPRTPDLDLFVGMTTYGGNPTGRVTLSALTLAQREDWSRTLAYVLDTGDATEGRRIRLNVRSREPNGNVEPGGDYDRVCARIADGVLALRDDDGRPLVSRVYTRDELYRGPHAHEGPDLVAVFAEGVGGAGPTPELAGYSFDGPVSVRVAKGNSGNHRPDGIFVAWGAGIGPARPADARIVDVCPTVLHLLDVPVPPDTDGRVLAEIMVAGGAGDSVEAPASGGAPSPVAVPQQTPEGGEPYTDDDRRKVEERLRKLGYIE
ncbi:MAG: alkaline phosphatase family protein [bacterium]|nr:alkaline phosphatase family protein [bacterium]